MKVAKYLCKGSWNSGQLRITIPKALVAEMELEGVEYMMLSSAPLKCIKMWRFIDGKSLKGAIKGDKSKQD